MRSQNPLVITASDMRRRFRHYSEVATVQPVRIKRRGKDDAIIIPIEEYHRLASRSE